jgi:hypothetical protein
MRYTIYTIAILATYTVMEWRGINVLPTSQRELIPASVRSSPGGYRSFHRINYGFHGGK